MGKSGVITKKDTGKDNEVYHDIITLLKIYRSVNWCIQVKIGQVKRRFQAEYGSDVDEFLNQIYEAGMVMTRLISRGGWSGYCESGGLRDRDFLRQHYLAWHKK